MALGCSGLHANCYYTPQPKKPRNQNNTEIAPPYVIFTVKITCYDKK